MSKKLTKNEQIAIAEYPEPGNESELSIIHPTNASIAYKERMAFLRGLNYKKQQRENKRHNIQR